jgi:hypothetical protein
VTHLMDTDARGGAKIHPRRNSYAKRTRICDHSTLSSSILRAAQASFPRLMY